ncbi:hypothetical protein [Paenibacillus ginsengarvi]|uniref:Uncharacterized protein n=1 Tax=Paenibacillus ginsengarvi TaxID=400777 RepID=A0A3B0AWQ6_9BACL|nr:hypothetical protein [Paenibacillus ginsengarvi]RKN64888.1 hypothetical protein D7M11_33400 [Paenibacillus ginsengarvi]
MRFVTETRMKRLEELLRRIPGDDDRSYALHLLESIRADIERNYAEIQHPPDVGRLIRPTGDDNDAEGIITLRPRKR